MTQSWQKISGKITGKVSQVYVIQNNIHVTDLVKEYPALELGINKENNFRHA